MKAIEFREFVEIDDDVRLIDVREPDEWDEVHVRGAELHPLSKIRRGDLPEPDERPVYVICRSGGRSAVACQAFEQSGFSECTNISDGTLGAIALDEAYVERGE